MKKQLDETLLNIQLLKKEHLVEIKSLGSPPIAVKTTLAGLVILFEKLITNRGGEIIVTTVGEGGSARKEENYFETAKRYLLNDPKELLELLN